MTLELRVDCAIYCKTNNYEVEWGLPTGDPLRGELQSFKAS